MDPTASCITHGRNLFCRLVFLVGVDPSLATHVIALWLLIEGNGEANFLQRVGSLRGDQFLANAAMGERLIRALNDRADKAPGSAVRTAFHKQAIDGVRFFLDNVCYKVLADLRQKADEQGVTGHVGQGSSHPNSSRLLQQFKQDYWQPQISTNYHGGESSSSRSIPSAAIQLAQDTVRMWDGAPSQNASSTDLNVFSPQHQRNNAVIVTSESNINDLASALNRRTISPQYQFEQSFSQSSKNSMGPYCRAHLNRNSTSRHDDRRTLFVTFSNGLPLTEEEVYDFFISRFGDVESVSVEVPIERRPPQYELVTFGSRNSVLPVLDGNDRAEFMSGRKHLWARKSERKKPFKAQNSSGLLK